jgi:hypothetical protein
MVNKNDSEAKNSAAKNTLLNSAAQWSSGYVARTAIKEFTGGAISPSYMANLDCIGQSCEGMFKIGRHVVYDKEKLTAWLISRISP